MLSAAFTSYNTQPGQAPTLTGAPKLEKLCNLQRKVLSAITAIASLLTSVQRAEAPTLGHIVEGVQRLDLPQYCSTTQDSSSDSLMLIIAIVILLFTVIILLLL